MTYKENITAILECYFTGFKKEIIDSACNRILEQEPILDKIRAEIEQRSYGVANDSVIQGMKYERAAILEILDKYKAESEVEDGLHT